MIAGRGCASRSSVPLLAAPPAAGELRATLAALSSKTWQHPATGTAVSFGVSTLERWFYRARRASLDPVAVYLLELDLPEPDLSIYDRDPGDT